MNTQNPLNFIGRPVSNLDEARLIIPSAFATHPEENRSAKYSFVPTTDLLTSFEKLGWNPTHVKQCGRGEFSRHTIRLTNEKFKFIDNVDKITPQIILDNSHNGSSPAQLHMGMFRLVCTNGLVVSIPGFYSGMKLRHMGINMEELKQLSETALDHFNKVSKRISKMQQIELSQAQKEEFVVRAFYERSPSYFVGSDGQVNRNTMHDQLDFSNILTPVREEDKKSDLWTIFNLIQEKSVKGMYERKTTSGRVGSPKGITNAVRSINHNKALWEIAEGFIKTDVNGKFKPNSELILV